MKKKKKLKGMTLVEIVVSIAVFAAISLILVMVGSAVNAQQRSANRVNRKVAVQGPLAEAQNDANALLLNDEYEIYVAKKDSPSSGVTVKGKLYSTEEFVIDEDGNKVSSPDAEKANLKFIEIQKPNPGDSPVPPAAAPESGT
ncbi:MAG: prepilin-type N-terminal cleavage/methylation domain-containing protein [Ruminococcus sp.]|jgi:prepilin-type N-terminal cleavage/methylation domain-containing protein|nr:prepilin-type N-terminal cleavage/methylation domain-containing protein [Ruminococcus sp.]MBQ9078720.1 prepilin-type N-terminal cleavage/methylation domain-containing protein [Ruminococcus sp.]MBR6624398.1 prepilin-type N-terminal cleavage/methylation domain-containing protein [Ruminococcus sp.]